MTAVTMGAENQVEDSNTSINHQSRRPFSMAHSSPDGKSHRRGGMYSRIGLSCVAIVLTGSLALAQHSGNPNRRTERKSTDNTVSAVMESPVMGWDLILKN